MQGFHAPVRFPMTPTHDIGYIIGAIHTTALPHNRTRRKVISDAPARTQPPRSHRNHRHRRRTRHRRRNRRSVLHMVSQSQRPHAVDAGVSHGCAHHGDGSQRQANLRLRRHGHTPAPRAQKLGKGEYTSTNTDGTVRIDGVSSGQANVTVSCLQRTADRQCDAGYDSCLSADSLTQANNRAATADGDVTNHTIPVIIGSESPQRVTVPLSEWSD